MAHGGVTGELARFLPVGVSTVAVDYASYLGLLALGVEASIAKAIGFITGAVLAFFLNQRLIFGKRTHGVLGVLAFAVVYLLALGANVTVNEFALNALSGIESYSKHIAFLVATGVSATINFIGIKFAVF